MVAIGESTLLLGCALLVPRIPYLDRMIVARRGDVLATRRPGYRAYAAGMTIMGEELTLRCDIPYLDRMITIASAIYLPSGDHVSACVTPEDLRLVKVTSFVFASHMRTI